MPTSSTALAYRDGELPQLVSVVMPCRNGAPTLKAQLDALATQSYDGDWEFVLADNGSSDGSAEIVRSYEGRLPHRTIVDASRAPGIDVARNDGAGAARGDLLLYCDSDDVVTTGWIAAMAEAARHADIVGGPLDHGSLNDPVVAHWRGTGYAADALPVALQFLPYAPGANIGIRADVLAAVGGWDETYRGGADEIELCWRCQLAGYRLGFAPGAVMKYHHRDDLRAAMRQQYSYGQMRARLYRDFRSAGVPRQPLKRAGRQWLVHISNLVQHWNAPEIRDRHLLRAAYRAGAARGSVRHRVVCF